MDLELNETPELPKNFKAVDSSQIKAIAFEAPDGSDGLADPDCDSGILRVMFKQGTVWRYDSVTKEKAQQLLAAESVGKFFNANIKGNKDHAATKEQPAPAAE